MRIGGWLLVFGVLLLIWQPLSLALTAPHAIDELPLRGPGLAIILAVRVLAAGGGIAAALALFGRRAGAISLAKASLVFSAAVDLLVYATPYYPNNRPPGDTTIILIVSLSYYVFWLSYLFRSKRVKATLLL
jgi:peptidoglycan/LPS O-acetylase OafA/YrhL